MAYLKRIYVCNRPTIKLLPTEHSLNMHIMYIIFYVVSSIKNRDQLIPKIPEKVWLPRHLLSDFHQKLIEINLLLNNSKYKILWNSID